MPKGGCGGADVPAQCCRSHTLPSLPLVVQDLPTEILKSITSKQGKLISLFLKWDKVS